MSSNFKLVGSNTIRNTPNYHSKSFLQDQSSLNQIQSRSLQSHNISSNYSPPHRNINIYTTNRVVEHRPNEYKQWERKQNNIISVGKDIIGSASKTPNLDLSAKYNEEYGKQSENTNKIKELARDYSIPAVKDYRLDGNRINEKPTLSYAHISTPERLQSTSKGLVGLRNLGNTCYMNSIIQCLLHTHYLHEVFSNPKKLTDEINSNSRLRGELAFKFGELVREFKSSPSFSSVSPYEIKRLIGRFAPQFSGYDQEDAAEFLRTILDALNQDLNRVSGKPRYESMTGNMRDGIERVAERW